MSKTQVKPIPEGMHTVTPHLVCADAATDGGPARQTFTWRYPNR